MAPATLAARELPSRRLSAEPAVNSIDDVAIALAELAYLKSADDEAQAKLEGRIAKLKRLSEERRVIDVDDQPVAFSVRMQTLTAAVIAFAEANPDAIKTGKKKTRKFTHGEISLKLTPLGVALREGYGWDDVIAAIEENGMPRFIQTKKELDKRRLISEVDSKKLDDPQLYAIGLAAVRPTDRAHLKLSVYTCEAPVPL